jgi:hypothetical protein
MTHERAQALAARLEAEGYETELITVEEKIACPSHKSGGRFSQIYTYGVVITGDVGVRR